MYNDVKALNKLIRYSIDSTKEYAASARQAGKGDLFRFLLARAIERETFVSRLQDSVRALGFEPVNDGTASATAKHFLSNLIVHIATKNTKAIMQEVESGEARIQQAFEAVMKDISLSGRTYMVISEIHKSLQADRARTLEIALQHEST